MLRRDPHKVFEIKAIKLALQKLEEFNRLALPLPTAKLRQSKERFLTMISRAITAIQCLKLLVVFHSNRVQS